MVSLYNIKYLGFGKPPRSDSALYKFINLKKYLPITLTETTAQSSFRTARRYFIYAKGCCSKAFIATIESF